MEGCGFLASALTYPEHCMSWLGKDRASFLGCLSALRNIEPGEPLMNDSTWPFFQGVGRRPTTESRHGIVLLQGRQIFNRLLVIAKSGLLLRWYGWEQP